MKMTPLQIAAALQTIQQAALTFTQVKELLARKDITVEEVEAQLDKTDATIDRLRDDDAPAPVAG